MSDHRLPIAGPGQAAPVIADATVRPLAELHRRSRNMFALLRAIVRRSAESCDQVDDFVMHLEGRLDAIARAQAIALRDTAEGMDLAQLVANELRVYLAREGERVTLEGPAVLLRDQAIDSLGLAFHELATNALKFGALSGQAGRIAVTWSVEGDAGRLALAWRETGGPALAEAPRSGFGTEVLTRLLPYELGAQVTLAFPPEGLCCTLFLPLGTMIRPVGD